MNLTPALIYSLAVHSLSLGWTFCCAAQDLNPTPVVAPAPSPVPVEGQLLPAAQVDRAGVFLADVLQTDGRLKLPHVQVAPAPAFGATTNLTRRQILEVLTNVAPELATATWGGAQKVLVSRRSRSLGEGELRDLLRDALQQEQVKERGTLEIRFGRLWNPVRVPEEPLTLKVNELPLAGVTPNCIVRFEILAAGETVGSWQMSLQARVMQDVWVTRTDLKRGELFSAEHVVREKKDILLFREALTELPKLDLPLEIRENLRTGTVLASRHLRPRAVVRRGQMVDALYQDGALQILVKVEVMEDGISGQLVRVRNVKSNREFRGKVKNEDLVTVEL